jgi:hypothetical protein
MARALRACRSQYFYSPAESRQAGAFQQRAGLAKTHAILFYVEKTGMTYAIDRTDYCIRADKQRRKIACRVTPIAPVDQKTSS